MSEWDDLGAPVDPVAHTGWDDLGAPVTATAPAQAVVNRRITATPNPFGGIGPGTGILDPDTLPPGQAPDTSYDDLGLPVASGDANPIERAFSAAGDAGRVGGDARLPSTTYRGDGSAYQAGLAVRPALGQDAPYVATGEVRVPDQGMFGAAAASLARGAITGTADVVAGGVRMAGRVLDNVVDPDTAMGMAMGAGIGGQSPGLGGRHDVQRYTDAAASRIGQAGTDAADSAVPVDSKYANSTWVKTAGVVGGALPYLAAAAVTGPAGPVSTALAGAAGTYETMYQDAIAHGATPDKAHEAALAPAIAGGALMTVNAQVLLKGLPWATQQALVRPVVDTFAASGTMVGVSELQKLVNNAAAQQTYDPGRSLAQGLGEDMLPAALAGGLLHAGVASRGAVSGALQRLSEPVAAPELRQGVAGMTEAAAGANERTANTAAPAPDAPPGNGNDPGGTRPIPPPVDPNIGGVPLPSRNDNLAQGAPRDLPYTTRPATTLTPDDLPANANRPGGQFSDEQRTALAGLGYSPADIAAMPPDAAGRVIEQGLSLPAPQAERGGPDRMAPIDGRGFAERAGGLVSRLQADLGLTRDQAAGVAGNLGHESAGLQAGIQERNPTSGRGGLGWGQWTGPRRVAFEKYAADRGLTTADPEANYGFLVHELRGAESGALDALRGADGVEAATRVFEEKFERAGVKAMGSRLKFARLAAGAMPETAAAASGDAVPMPRLEDAAARPDPKGEALAAQVAQGMEGTQPVYTNSGTRVDVRPEVVELSSLTASHDQDGRTNPAFPHAEGVQPRDRSSAASQAQIQDMASGLVPERLGTSPDAGSGAPIVSSDGVVESGNGRTLALGRVYGDPALADQAASYKAFLAKQGFDVSGMDQPVLVSRRVTPLDDAGRAAFALEANERSTLAMSQAEQARADAPRAAGIMGLWSGDDPAGAGNRDFVRAFMARVTPEEAGAMRLPDGSLSPEGARRIQSAVTVGAYGDVMGPTLDRALNGNSEGMRSVAGALSDAAGPWASMRQAAAEGRIPKSLDVTRALGEAVDTLTRARQLNRPVRELVGQADLDRPGLSPEGQAVLGMMFNNPAMTQPAGRARVAERLRAYAEEAAKASPGPDMFGAPPPAVLDVAAAAMRRTGRDAVPQTAMLARREAAQAHAATMRDSGALTLTPEALAARDRLRTGAQAMMRFAGLPPEAGLKLVDRLLNGGADASYSRGLVTLALDTHPDALPAKMFHETVHALMDPKMGVLTDGQRAALLAGADRYLAKNPAIRQHLQDLYGTDRTTLREEAVARMGEDAFRAGLMRQTPGAVVYGKLLNAVRGLGSMLRGQGYRTADDVFRAVLRGDKAAPGSREALASVGPRDPVRAAAAAHGTPLPAGARQDGANENGQNMAQVDRTAESSGSVASTAPQPNPATDPTAAGRNVDPTAAAIARQGAVPERYFSLRDRPVVAHLAGDEIVARPGETPRKAAERWAVRNLRGQAVRSAALGADVAIGRRGLDKTINRSTDELLRAMPAIPALIERGKLLVSDAPPRDPTDSTTKAWHTLGGVVRVDGKDMPLVVNIREAQNGQFFYNLGMERSGADPHKAGSLGQSLNLSHVEPAPGQEIAPPDAPIKNPGDAAAQQVGGIPLAAGADTNRTTAARSDIATPDDGSKYSRRAPLLSDKAAMEREGQQALFGRTAQQAQQARDDAGGLRSDKAQRPADELPLFTRDHKQASLFSLRQNFTTALQDSAAEPRRAMSAMLNQALFPMRQGSQQAQVAAFKFANALRGIQYRYGQMDRQITKQFTADERAAMGRALDAQSVFEQSKPDAAARAAFDAGKTGLAGLSDKQRATVETLNQLAQQTWQRLADRKLVTPGAEGLPYYMPRQFVMLDGLGGARRIAPEDNQLAGQPGGKGGGGSGGGMTAMDPKGGNLTDRGPMERKHLTADESAAAARAKFGDGVELVTDIRSLVDALSRQERAVAGRDLIDAIKRTGEAGGMDLVREGDQPGRGFFTLDHPSLWTVGPTGAEGPDGKAIFGRTPLHIAEEFRGPLDAVLSRSAPDWYKAIQAVKSKSMGAIMFSPFMHLMVEVGRSLPLFHGNPVALGRAMVRGAKMRDDLAQMDKAVKDGLAPIGAGWGKFDPVSVANDVMRAGDGSWLRKLASGDHAVGRAWHAMHQTLLWDQVGNLQNGIYADMRARYVAKGFAPEAAGVMAAHLANRYAGALPPEHLSRFANMGANLTMFSRSFTLGNLGVMKDMLNGAPSHIRAAILEAAGEEQAGKAATALKRKAIAAFALDIGLFYGLNAVAQSGFAVARNMGQGDNLPEAAGKVWRDYLDGMSQGILPQLRNEPGKEDRIYVGQDSGGIGTYARTPLGKVGEEFMGWLPILGHPGQMMLNKANPLLRAAWESVQGKDSLNRPIYNPHAEGIAEKMGVARDIAFHFGKSLVPADFVGQVYNAATGQQRGDRGVALARIAGPLTGLASISQGNHEGPQAGVEQAATQRQAYARQMAVPEARKLVAAGKPDEARALLEQALGNPRDAQAAIKPMLNPAHVQVRRDAQFQRRASDEQKARAAGVTGGRGGSLGIASMIQ